MVASHRKLCALFLNQEVGQVGLLRELVAEAYPIVVDAKADDDGAIELTGSHTGTARFAGKTFEPLL